MKRKFPVMVLSTLLCAMSITTAFAGEGEADTKSTASDIKAAAEETITYSVETGSTPKKSLRAQNPFFKDSVTASAGLERSYDGTAWDPHAVLKDKKTGEVLEEDEHYTRELYYYGARENGEIKTFHDGRPDYVNPGILEERFYPKEVLRGSSNSSGEDVIIVRHITYNDIVIKGTDYSAVEGGRIDMPQYEKISNGPIMTDNVPQVNAEVSIERWGEAMVLEDPEVGYIAGKPGKYNIIPMQRGLHEAIPNDGKVVDIFDNVWWAYTDNLDVAYQTGGVIRLLYRNGVLTITPKQDPNPDLGPGPNPNPNPNPNPGPNPDPGLNPGNNPAPSQVTPTPSEPKTTPVEVNKASRVPNTGDTNNLFFFTTVFVTAIITLVIVYTFLSKRLERKV